MPAGSGHGGAPAAGDLDLAGWQAQMLARILDRDDEGRYGDRARLNGQTLAAWLRQDCPGASDVQLAVCLMTLYAFVRELDESTAQANGYQAMARAVVLAALEDSCQTAVLELTALARAAGA